MYSGITATKPAIIREVTRNGSDGTAITSRASISSLILMAPSCAVKPQPTVADNAAPPASTGVNGLASSARNALPSLVGAARVSPRSVLLRCASASVNPVVGHASRSSTVETGIACHGTVSTISTALGFRRPAACRRALTSATAEPAFTARIARLVGLVRASRNADIMPTPVAVWLIRMLWAFMVLAAAIDSMSNAAVPRSSPTSTSAPHGGEPSVCIPAPQSARLNA